MIAFDFRAKLPIALGDIVVSDLAWKMADKSIVAFLLRHATGDWGDQDAAACELNNTAVLYDLPILSLYALPETDERIAILTDGDRSRTLVMTEREYTLDDV